jgi:hypothetical protein
MAGRWNWKAQWDRQGHWNFEEGSDTTVADISGQGNDGTASGGMTWVTGQVGACAGNFSTSVVTLPVIFSGTTPTKFSVSFWANPDTIPVSSWAALFVQQDSGTSGNQNLNIYLNTDGTVNYDVFPPSGGSLATTATLSASTWTYVVVTRDGSDRKIYIDGSLDASDSSGETYTGLAVDETVFGDLGAVDTGHPFDGSIDDVRTYDRTITAPEVLHLYSYRGVSPSPDCIELPDGAGNISLNDGTDCIILNSGS